MNHYTLTRTAAKGNIFACFCHLRELMSVGRNTNNHFEAHKQAKAMEPEVLAVFARRAALAELARRAELKGKNPGASQPTQNSQEEPCA